jgi:hypothetical protein
VRTALDDAAIIDDQYLIGVANGAEAMGDDERGAPLHHAQ